MVYRFFKIFCKSPPYILPSENEKKNKTAKPSISSWHKLTMTEYHLYHIEENLEYAYEIVKTVCIYISWIWPSFHCLCMLVVMPYRAEILENSIPCPGVFFTHGNFSCYSLEFAPVSHHSQELTMDSRSKLTNTFPLPTCSGLQLGSLLNDMKYAKCIFLAHSSVVEE